MVYATVHFTQEEKKMQAIRALTYLLEKYPTRYSISFRNNGIDVYEYKGMFKGYKLLEVLEIGEKAKVYRTIADINV